MSHLELFLLGTYQIKLDGQLVTTFEADKVRALLAYLAVESAHPHRREQLATLFWPSWPDTSARTSLRNALSNLRKAIGDESANPPFLLITRETIQFNPASSYFLDTQELERLARDRNPSPDQLQSAINLYRGTFLEGFTLKDCPAFDDWSHAVKEQLQAQASAAFSYLAEIYEKGKELGKAIACARKRLAIEPWQEDAHRQLMRLLAASNQRLAALAQYEACRKVLKEELGVEPSVETRRLQASIREGEITASSTEKIRLHNLPAQVTSFIGREKEMQQVKSLLRTHRLVTLTGSGGAGKTRLSLQTGMELLGQYPDGVWLVELAPLANPELVVQSVARVLGMRLETGAQALSWLQDYLEPKYLLLILDNCEHLVEACARLADSLLHTCPHLVILASSREALGIEGETSCRVPPLTFPKADELLENLPHYEAIRLLVERAGAASPGFWITPENALAIVQICQRLDGIPLAIELAAARVKVLSVEEIALRLDDRFRLLTGGSRAALPRYQTLRASIDWSYDLLSPAERRLLQRLSVFARGWVLEAAEQVDCWEGVEEFEILDLLSQLVNKSLVTVEAETGPETRYGMLETIRQYAHEKLVESGESEVVRDQHLMYFVELAEKVERKIHGPDQARIMEQLEEELDNLRLALTWSLERKGEPDWDPKPGLRLASALLQFWHCRDREEEGLDWLERLLFVEGEGLGEKPASLDQVKIRAWALRLAGYLAYTLGYLRKATVLSEESKDLFASLGLEGKWGRAYAQLNFAKIARIKGNIVQAKALLEESLAIFREVGDQFAIDECLLEQGIIAFFNQELELARMYLKKNLAICWEIGDQDSAAFSLYVLGEIEALENEYEKARKLYEESRRMFILVKDKRFLPEVIHALGNLNWMEGNYAQAARDFDEILLTGRTGGNLSAISFGLSSLGSLALSRGDNNRAAKLFEEYLSFSCKKGNKYTIMDSLMHLGHLTLIQNDLPQAFKQYSEALAISRELGDRSCEAINLNALGKASLAGGNAESAREYFAKALELLPISNLYLNESMEILEGIALLAITQHQARRAACLLGSTQARHDRDFFMRPPKDRLARENAIASLRTEMGEEAFTTAWGEGKAMTLEHAIEYAKREM